MKTRRETLIDVRDGILKRSMLIAGHTANEDGNHCAIGALMPLGVRFLNNEILQNGVMVTSIYGRYVAGVKSGTFWLQYDDELLSPIILANNAFANGSLAPEDCIARRDYMLKYVEDQLAIEAEHSEPAPIIPSLVPLTV